MSTQTSPTSNEPGGAKLYRKPRVDIFTFLLVVSLIALMLATAALWAAMREYEYNVKGGPEPVGAVSHPSAAFERLNA